MSPFMRAEYLSPEEIGAVVVLLEAAHNLMRMDAMEDPIKFTLSIHAQAVPAAEYAMRLWASAHDCAITEWQSDDATGTRTLAMYDRLRRLVVTLHGAPRNRAEDDSRSDDLHHGDERGPVIQ